MRQVLSHNQCEDELARYRLLKAGLIKQSGTAVTWWLWMARPAIVLRTVATI